MVTTLEESPPITDNQQRGARYRELLKAGDIPQIKREFSEYFLGVPAIDSSFPIERVTRADLQTRIEGLYFTRKKEPTLIDCEMY